MPTATDCRPRVRIRYLHDARALYTPDNADTTDTTNSGVTAPADAPGLKYATPGSVGLDLRACLSSESVEIPAGERVAVPTGVAVEPVSPNIAGFVYSRSGLGAVQGLTVAQGVGVIDPDYRGEISVVLLNTSGQSRRLRRGERIAQLVFQSAFQVELLETAELGTTERGTGGFGHTGK